MNTGEMYGRLIKDTKLGREGYTNRVDIFPLHGGRLWGGEFWDYSACEYRLHTTLVYGDTADEVVSNLYERVYDEQTKTMA